MRKLEAPSNPINVRADEFGISDLQRFRRMFKLAGVEYQAVKTNVGYELKLTPLSGNRNNGMPRLYTVFTFTLEGELYSNGVWGG